MAVKLEVEVGGRRFQVEVTLETEDGELPFPRFLCRVESETATHRLPLRLLSRSQGSWVIETERRVEVLQVESDRQETRVDWNNRAYTARVADQRELLLRTQQRGEAEGRVRVKALMPGKVIRVLHGAGESVEPGEGLAVIEAMKMQNEIKSPKGGTVVACNLEVGKRVNAGEILFEIE